jgi:arylsulfatase A-like enzyme
MRPNVLLVVLDAARRDSLEPYGAPPGSTPSIAQLASRGVALPEVYATGCWTVPSHGSMFTGLLPRAAGLARAPTPDAPKPILAAQLDRLLPEVLRRAGYATGAVSANPWISAVSGFDAGFDELALVDGGRDSRVGEGGRRARLRWLAQAARGRIDDGAASARRTLERWAADAEGRPFFWFVNVVECHAPYLPPRPYGGVSTLERLRAAEDARRHYGLDAMWRACVGGYDVPEETMERMRGLYRASIRYMDDWLGSLLELLDGHGLLDDTLVVVAADHGENLGEGGLIGHAFSLDNRLIHVPCVVAGPGADGADINSLAELPALIAAAALDEHPWDDGPPPGVGIAQFDPPCAPGDPRVDEVVERWGLGEEAATRFTTPLTCAVAGDLKLLMRGEAEEVYDLGQDPLELRPLAPDAVAARETAVAPLREALRHPAVTARRAATAAGAPDAPDEELRDIEERMRLLGYM